MDVGVVDDAVDHGCGDGLVAEHASPAAEWQVGGEDQPGVLVAAADQTHSVAVAKSTRWPCSRQLLRVRLPGESFRYQGPEQDDVAGFGEEAARC